MPEQTNLLPQPSDHLTGDILRDGHQKIHFHCWMAWIRLGGELPRHRGTADEQITGFKVS